jgi:hypothetical protein
MPERQDSKKLEPIRISDYALAEHGFRRHSVMVRAGVGKDDITNPVLYEHIARNLRFGDEVRILHEEMEWYAMVLVTYASGTDIRVLVLNFVPCDEVKVEPQTDDYDVRHRGPRNWCLIKISTGEVIRDNLPNKAAAMKELAEHRTAMAA